jgi:hypothetical protein
MKEQPASEPDDLTIAYLSGVHAGKQIAKRTDMGDKQLGILYTVMLTIWMVAILGLSHYLDNDPINTESYLDHVCQELYGPQAGHVWIDDRAKCQTVRGEILGIRHP